MAITLNGTTGVVTADGSVAAPSLKGTDADSGVSFAADTIKFSTGGVERMAISNTGVTGVSGGILQVKQLREGAKKSTNTVITDNGFTGGEIFMSLAITPSAASSYIWVTGMLHLVHKSDYSGHYWLTYNHSSISEKMIAGNANTGRRRTGKYDAGGNVTTDVGPAAGLNIMFAPNTTEEITVRIRAATTEVNCLSYLNRNIADSTDTADGGNPLSTLTLAEVAGGISPNITDSTIYEGT